MLYSRDTQGRIVSVGTRATSGGTWTDLAYNINYQPMSRIVQSLTYENGLNDWNTFTNDYELWTYPGLVDGYDLGIMVSRLL